MAQQYSRTDLRRSTQCPQHGILQQVGTQTLSLPSQINREPAQHNRRNWIRHIAPDTASRMRALNAAGGERVISEHALAFANHETT